MVSIIFHLTAEGGDIVGTPRIDDVSRKSQGIGIRLSLKERDMVSYICKIHELDKSDMIRRLIRNEYDKCKAN